MAQDKPVLGLDFGTSNTAAAWCDAAGEVHLVPVREGVHALPSVVCYHPGGNLVGEAAREMLADDPRHTIHGIKRFLGRRFFSDYVGRHKSRFAFPLVEGDEGMVAVEVHGQKRSLEQVALDLVQRVVELANIALGEPFEEAVVSVPAHSSQRQRRLLARVIERAGLRLKAMVNEPTAAALYYAKHTTEDTKVLVYDLGGGTFDTTLLRVRRGLVEVLATGGEAFLGGGDFDQKLAEHLVERFERDSGLDMRGDPVVMQRLQMAAETAKIRLSKDSDAQVRVPCVHMDGDRFFDLDYGLTRGELEGVVAPLIERTLGIAQHTVASAGVAPNDVDEVLLIGGQTKMPGLKNRLRSTFRIDESRGLDPDLGVAIGAAILGRGLQVLVDVLSIPIGVMLPGAGPHEAIPKNTPLPCVKRMPVSRPPPGQMLPMIVYEALEATSIDRDILGTLKVAPAWLEQHGGDLKLEVRMSSSFELSFFLRTSEGGELPLAFSEDAARAEASGSEAALPEAAGASFEVARQDNPRVPARMPVSVRYYGELDFRVLDTHNISPLGVYLCTEEPPQARTPVDLMLEANGESIALRGIVMHCLNPQSAAAIGQPAGFGVRLQPPTMQVRERLEALAQRLLAGGEPEEEPEEQSAPDLAAAEAGEGGGPLDLLRRFMEGVAKNDYYTALGIAPLATTVEVKERVDELNELIKRILPKVSPKVAVKLKTAGRILERVCLVLYDPRRRLAHDFQRGHVFAEERLAESISPDASSIFDVELLREAWRKVHPGEVDRAAVHAARAAKAEASGDLAAALSEAREALALDPFDVQLRIRIVDLEP